MTICKGLSAYLDPDAIITSIVPEYKLKLGKDAPPLDLARPLKQWTLAPHVQKWEGLRTFHVLAREWDGRLILSSDGTPMFRPRSMSYDEAVAVNITSGETNSMPALYMRIAPDPMPYKLPEGRRLKLYTKESLPSQFSMQALFNGSDQVFVVDLDLLEAEEAALPSNENILKELKTINEKLDILLSK